MHQNLDMWGTLDFSSWCRFELMFRRWKSIGQVKPRYSLAMRRRKMQHKALLDFVSFGTPGLGGLGKDAPASSVNEQDS